MKHAHHDMIVEWAKDTSRVVEVLNCLGKWNETLDPLWASHHLYRFKPAEPKYIVVNGVNVPEQVREPLKYGQEYWLADVCCSAHSVIWDDSSEQITRYLSLGLIHLTKEAAQAHIDAMLLPSRTYK